MEIPSQPPTIDEIVQAEMMTMPEVLTAARFERGCGRVVDTVQEQPDELGVRLVLHYDQNGNVVAARVLVPGGNGRSRGSR